MPDFETIWDATHEFLRQLQHVYVTSMRGSMFTGFLTMCSFLMAAKTFLVTNLKQEVYSRKEYVQFHLDTAPHPDRVTAAELNEPLRDLSRLLLRNVTLSLITCVAQFSVGLIPCWPATLVCLGLAAVTVGYLAKTLFKMRGNLHVMFAWMDKSAEKTLTEVRQSQVKKQ